MPGNTIARLTDTEIAVVADLLRKLEPGFLPYPIFREIARLTVLAIVEVVPVRRDADGNVEVLLTRREADDPIWPGLWHNPGSVVLATDEDDHYADAFRRIFAGELELAAEPEPHFVAGYILRTSRGNASVRVYWAELAELAELTGRPSTGSFFPIDSLPDNIIESQVEVIAAAARAYAEFTA